MSLVIPPPMPSVFTLESIITFGKYKVMNYTLRELIDLDPDYVDWCLENIEWFKMDKAATQRLAVTYRNSDDDFDYSEYWFTEFWKD